LKTRHKRIALIIGGLAVLGLVVALVLNAFQSNLVFFFSPTQVAAGEAPNGKSFRIGGLVKEGKGAVAQGKLGEDGVFVASEVLAKHDENYMPPEAVKAVGDAQQRAAANKAVAESTAKTVKQ